MYSSALFIHSWLRWVVFILMLAVIIKSIMGLTGNKSYEKFDRILTASTVGTLHLQLFIGLALYIFLSPLTQAAFNDFGAAMKEASLRYWAVEHIFAMIVAIGLAEVGKSKAKKATEDRKKFRFQLIFFVISLLVMLSRIPFNESARLFR